MGKGGRGRSWAVALAVAVGLLDYSRPEDNQTHAGRFVGDVLHGRAWTTVHRKADAVLGSLATPAVTAARRGRRRPGSALLARHFGCRCTRASELGPPTAAVAVLAVLGSLLNDSGVFVAAAALLAFVPAAVAATLGRREPGDTGRL